MIVLRHRNWRFRDTVLVSLISIGAVLTPVVWLLLPALGVARHELLEPYLVIASIHATSLLAMQYVYNRSIRQRSVRWIAIAAPPVGLLHGAIILYYADRFGFVVIPLSIAELVMVAMIAIVSAYIGAFIASWTASTWKRSRM